MDSLLVAKVVLVGNCCLAVFAATALFFLWKSRRSGPTQRDTASTAECPRRGVPEDVVVAMLSAYGSTSVSADVESQCVICHEELGVEVFQLACGHRFHTACIVGWLRNNSCPVCRQRIW